MAITDKGFEAANRRGAEKKATFPVAVSVRYDRHVSRVVITLATGLELAFSPKHAQGLEHAHPTDLADAEISPSGLGIHFPRLDADIYIPALLEGSSDPTAGSPRRSERLGAQPRAKPRRPQLARTANLAADRKRKKELAGA